MTAHHSHPYPPDPADTGRVPSDEDDGLVAVTPIATITVDVNAREAVVRPVGELDVTNADTLGVVLDRVLARHPRRIVIDLAGTKFVDLIAVATLERHGYRNNERVVVTNAHGIVERLLTLLDTLGWPPTSTAGKTRARP